MEQHGCKPRCRDCKNAARRARYATDEAYREAHKARVRDAYQDDPAVRARVNAAGLARYHADPEPWRERNRAINKRLQVEQRAYWVAYLGGLCVDCGADENLEFDHVDWREKNFSIASRLLGADIKAEVDRCQLRCVTCHRAKTVGDVRSRRQLGKGSSKTYLASNLSPGSGTSSTT